MSLHGYKKGAVTGDYVRGGLGFAVTAFPVAFAPMLGTFQIVFLLIALVFAGFIVKTWLRAQTRYEVDDDGIQAQGPLSKTIKWSELAVLDLRYYSTQKEKNSGWMHLVLKDRNGDRLNVLRQFQGDFAWQDRGVAESDRQGAAHQIGGVIRQDAHDFLRIFALGIAQHIQRDAAAQTMGH